MNFENMNNNLDNGYERALEIIRRDSQNRPIVGCCEPRNNNGGGAIGPTGPTGPTGPIGATGATGPTGPTSKG